MRCLKRTLMLGLLTLSLSNCTTVPTDSFCQIYRPVVVQKGDGAIAATVSVKRRILANELTYRDQCSN